MSFAILEAAVEPRAVLPDIHTLAVGLALHEVADVRVGAFRLAGPLCEFGAFVAFAVERADEIAVFQPAIVRNRRRGEHHQHDPSNGDWRCALLKLSTPLLLQYRD